LIAGSRQNFAQKVRLCRLYNAYNIMAAVKVKYVSSICACLNNVAMNIGLSCASFAS